MGKYIETALEVFRKAGEQWKQMVEVPVSDEQALAVLQLSTGKKTTKTYSEIMEGRNSKIREALVEWERYKDSMGSNKFALLNTVTQLSTHAKVKRGDVIILKTGQDKLRDKALISPTFTRIAAVG